MHTLFSLPFMLPMLYTLKAMSLCVPGIRARPLRPSRIPSRAISNDPPLAVNSPNPAGSHATVETSPRPSRKDAREGRVLNAGSDHGRLEIRAARAAAAYLSLADHGHVEDALEMGIPHRRHQQPPHEWPSLRQRLLEGKVAA